MPISVYVSRDSEGHPWPPDHNQETLAVLAIVRQLWGLYHNQPSCYAIVANLHKPSADLVIISEHGLGVIELKFHYGTIAEREGRVWYAGTTPIKAGSQGQGRRNPYEQVHHYAEQIRTLLEPYLRAAWRDVSDPHWQKFKTQTAVCFTHPSGIDMNAARQLKDQTERHIDRRTNQWEQFCILTPGQVPDWVMALRFEVTTGHEHGFAPVCLRPTAIEEFVTRQLHATPWTEIVSLMPTGQPYGYLSLLEGGVRIMAYSLDRDKHILGRDPTQSTIWLPQSFLRVSRRHAHLSRTIEGVFLADAASKYGTFVDGHRIRSKLLLRAGHQITLGGPTITDTVCLLEFSTSAPEGVMLPSTTLDSKRASR